MCFEHVEQTLYIPPMRRCILQAFICTITLLVSLLRRTFQGVVCLMQLSTRERDYIVDPLKLRGDMGRLLPIFSDPTIVKVGTCVHGSVRHDVALQKTGFEIFMRWHGAIQHPFGYAAALFCCSD